MAYVCAHGAHSSHFPTQVDQYTQHHDICVTEIECVHHKTSMIKLTGTLYIHHNHTRYTWETNHNHETWWRDYYVYLWVIWATEKHICIHLYTHMNIGMRGPCPRYMEGHHWRHGAGAWTKPKTYREYVRLVHSRSFVLVHKLHSIIVTDQAPPNIIVIYVVWNSAAWIIWKNNMTRALNIPTTRLWPIPHTTWILFQLTIQWHNHFHFNHHISQLYSTMLVEHSNQLAAYDHVDFCWFQTKTDTPPKSYDHAFIHFCIPFYSFSWSFPLFP